MNSEMVEKEPFCAFTTNKSLFTYVSIYDILFYYLHIIKVTVFLSFSFVWRRVHLETWTLQLEDQKTDRPVYAVGKLYKQH